MDSRKDARQKPETVGTSRRSSRSVRWIHETRVDGIVTFRSGKRGGRLVARWPGVATLTCAADGSGARLVPVAGVSRRAIDGLAVPVSALLRDLAGQPALHASAVAVGGRAVLFLGESGAGKSTAAAELCLRHGARLLADDVALVEVGESQIRILASEESHWLSRDSCLALDVPRAPRSSGGEKRAFRSPSATTEPCVLALVVALSVSRGPMPTVDAARGGDAARALLSAAIRFDVEDASARRREFEQLTAIHERTPFIVVTRPADAPGPIAPLVLDALRRTAS